MALFQSINGTILNALQLVFTQCLQLEVGKTDSLYLKTLKLAPLQDDPTQVAPYVIYDFVSFEPDPRYMEHGQVQVEIGGPLYMRHHFCGECGIPRATTRFDAKNNIDELVTRMVSTLIRFNSLAGVLAPGDLVSPNGTKRIEAATPFLVPKASWTITGGDQEFYAKGHVDWYYPVGWYEQYRVFTPGAFT